MGFFVSKELWEIKYRPQTLDDYIFQNEKHKDIITKFVEEQRIPHLLLSGHRGTGKTSLAFLLKNLLNIEDNDFVVLNASDNNSVDDMRKLGDIVSACPYGEIKLILLDEADYLSQNAQALLRNMMEEYADNARFILSCNKINKIIPELKSRCFELHFKSIDKMGMMERLAIIIDEEKIKATMENLESVVDAAYPDMRKAVQLLQNNVKDGKLTDVSDVDDSTEAYLDIIDLMVKDQYKKIREVLQTFTVDDYDGLYPFLYTYLEEVGKFSDENKWKRGIVLISDYLDRHMKNANPEITAMAMFLRMSDI